MASVFVFSVHGVPSPQRRSEHQSLGQALIRTASLWVFGRISLRSLETRRSTGCCPSSPGKWDKCRLQCSNVINVLLHVSDMKNRGSFKCQVTFVVLSGRILKANCTKFCLSPIFLVYYSQGDGLTFPTRLVNTDVEQATVTLQPEPNKRW